MNKLRLKKYLPKAMQKIEQRPDEHLHLPLWRSIHILHPFHGKRNGDGNGDGSHKAETSQNAIGLLETFHKCQRFELNYRKQFGEAFWDNVPRTFSSIHKQKAFDQYCGDGGKQMVSIPTEPHRAKKKWEHAAETTVKSGAGQEPSADPESIDNGHLKFGSFYTKSALFICFLSSFANL
ncbi:uncharacterized protein ACOB8E_016594 isoform 2-T3 [Sarcophilus harrisii]